MKQEKKQKRVSMPSRYVRVTEREFELIRNEIYAAESASGGMDENAAQEVRMAFKAIQSAEKRNDIKPLQF
jgi:predicted glycosyl hydrolase (DUF1957 family)